MPALLSKANGLLETEPRRLPRRVARPAAPLPAEPPPGGVRRGWLKILRQGCPHLEARGDEQARLWSYPAVAHIQVPEAHVERQHLTQGA
jgi:hypothetical protein